MKTRIPPVLIALTLVCFGLSPQVRAVCQEGCDDTNTNTFLGDNALINNDGLWNTAVGGEALFSNTNGIANTATGYLALTSNTMGTDNTANGYQALEFNTEGEGNTAIGAAALFFNTTGLDNTAIGRQAMEKNSTGGFNTAIGAFALDDTTGSSNTAIGNQAMEKNSTGGFNTAIGAFALDGNTTGSSNIALGRYAGSKITTGNNNIDIGNRGVLGGEDNKIRIGTTGSHMATFIAGINGVSVPDGVGVIVGTDGKLGTVVSSERFKDSIKPMDKASDAILALKPVTFRYKHNLDPKGIPQFGLVAEQVEKVDPDLVARDDQGKAYTVRYEAVNAMLLNEFLKEHRKVEDLKDDFQAAIAQQQKEIAYLIATVKEQASQIQKVSAQLEASKPAPQVVNNP